MFQSLFILKKKVFLTPSMLKPTWFWNCRSFRWQGSGCPLHPGSLCRIQTPWFSWSHQRWQSSRSRGQTRYWNAVETLSVEVQLFMTCPASLPPRTSRRYWSRCRGRWRMTGWPEASQSCTGWTLTDTPWSRPAGSGSCRPLSTDAHCKTINHNSRRTRGVRVITI